MKRVSVPDLEPGLQVARDLTDGRGGILLRRGVRLSTSHIRALAERGFAWIYVADDAGDDIAVESLVQSYLNASAEPVLRYLAGLSAETQPRSLDAAMLEEDLDRVAYTIGHILSADVLTVLGRMATTDTTLLYHGLHTALIGLQIGVRMALDEGTLRSLAVGCLLHDCGKASLGHHFFLLPTLSGEQLAELQRHPLTGLRVIRDLNLDDADAAAIVVQHHERQDGRGYPRGLHGVNRVESALQSGRISLSAEVGAIADVAAMLMSDTLGTTPLSAVQVGRVLRGLSGTVLNRQLVAHLLEGRTAPPVGLKVRVASGRYAGCRGTVVRVSPVDGEHVVVRLNHSTGGWMQPTELDTAVEEDACLRGELR